MRRDNLKAIPRKCCSKDLTCYQFIISRNDPLIQFPNANQFLLEAQDFSDQGCSHPVY